MGTLKIKVGGQYVTIPRGPKGETGPANTLSIGTVTSGATPSATITGTAPAQTLNLVLQKGDTGPAGGVDSVDGLQGAVDLTTKYLQLAGGTLTGRLILKAMRETTINKGVTSGTVTFDISQGTMLYVAPNAATTIAFSNYANGDSWTLRINSWEAGYPGSVTWPAGIYWAGGVLPVLPAGKHHVLTFWADSGAIFASYVGGFATV
jgi:hypothetical protein